MQLQDALKTIGEASYRLKKFGELSSIGSYDMTATAPKGAAKRRAELLSFVRAESRKTLLAPETLEAVETLAAHEDELSPEMKGELRLYRRRIDAVTGLPETLLQRQSALKSATEQLWIENKYTGDYAGVKAGMKEMIELQKEADSILAARPGGKAPAHPLDPVIDGTDPGMTVAKLEPLFDEIRSRTVPLLQKIAGTGWQPDRSFTKGGYDTGVQREIALKLLAAVGYNPRYGVVGTGEHPCTYGVNRYDVRFTGHFYPDDLLQGTISAMHEGGHGMYEQNVSEDYLDLLIGGGSHGGMHESSSRFWENMVGRSEAFWDYAAPLFKEAFPGRLREVPARDFFLAVNRVQPSLVRIYADELTYNLHIMMRFEIEKMLFDGSLSADDLEDAWNEKSRAYLGIVPEKPWEGWAQDMHWPAGMFGYFQSYTIGTLNAAQIGAAVKKALLNFDGLIRAGEFAPIRAWLTEHWYRHGMLWDNNTLLQKITGEPLSAGYLCDYLEEKFSAIYGV